MNTASAILKSLKPLSSQMNISKGHSGMQWLTIQGKCRGHSLVTLRLSVTLGQEHIHVMEEELRQQREDLQRRMDNMTKVG